MSEINFFKWRETPTETKSRIMRRAQADIESVAAIVRPVIDDVRDNGDDALRRYAKKFDGADLNTIKATPDEFARAEKNAG